MAELNLRQQIAVAEEEVRALKHQYLQRHGWTYSSDTPGSFWLWRRDFEVEDLARHAAWKERPAGPLGKSSEPRPHGVITANTDLAVSITQRVLDEEIDQDGDPDTPTITAADLEEECA